MEKQANKFDILSDKTKKTVDIMIFNQTTDDSLPTGMFLYCGGSLATQLATEFGHI